MRAKSAGASRAPDQAKANARAKPKGGVERVRAADPLMVGSVEKAFRVLGVFDEGRASLSLSQIAELAGLDLSAAQRFTHTLLKLGYLRKDPATRRLELSPRTLDMAAHFLAAHPLVKTAMPYLMHLSRETEETVNLTLLDGVEIVFVARFLSRHVLNTDVVIGTRMPAYCTAPGRAILSRLPQDEAMAIIDACRLVAHTKHTTWRREDLVERLEQARRQGYETQFQEFIPGDASVAAAILDAKGRPRGAINVAASCSRYRMEEVAERFAPLAVAAAHALSRA
jgi:IclR family pca regulon transcriptional regulator